MGLPILSLAGCNRARGLEAAARKACDSLVGAPLTDQEWAAMRARLLAFFATLRRWERADDSPAETR